MADFRKPFGAISNSYEHDQAGHLVRIRIPLQQHIEIGLYGGAELDLNITNISEPNVARWAPTGKTKDDVVFYTIFGDAPGTARLDAFIKNTKQRHASPVEVFVGTDQQRIFRASRLAFFTLHKDEARAVQIKTGFLASVLLGQSAAESGYGAKNPDNAFFGLQEHIKYKCKRKTTFTTSTFITTEPQSFCAYDDFMDASLGYCESIYKNPNSGVAYQLRNNANAYIDNMSGFYRGFVNPSQRDQYARDIKAIISQFNLFRFNTISTDEETQLLRVYGERVKYWDGILALKLK